MKRIIFILTFLAGANALAQVSFANISQQDLDDLNKDFSAAFGHHSVMGAEPLGDVFGIETSLVVGQTNTPNINRLSQENNPSSSVAAMPHAGILFGLSVPMGFTFEYLALPSFNSNGMGFSQNSIGLKWTSNKHIIVLPFDLAFRIYSSNMRFNLSQTAPVATDISFKNSQTGFQMLISPGLPAVEPYFGLGYIQARSTLDSSGSALFSIPSNSESSSSSSIQTIFGINFYAAFFSVGAEYVSSFGTSSYSGKIGFYF